MDTREDKRYYYLISENASQKRRGIYKYALMVGADWYVRGTMLRYIYASSAPLEDVTDWGIITNHPSFNPPIQPRAMSTFLRERGTRVPAEKALALFPQLAQKESSHA